PQDKGKWQFSAVLESEQGLTTSTSPAGRLSIADLIDAEAISSMKVSPDGALVAVEMRRPEVPADWAQSWVDIYGISEGKLLRTYEVSGLDWAPDGKSFVHIKDGHQGKQLWVTKIEGGDKLIVDGLKNLTGAWWMPDAKSLLYAIADEPEKDETGLKRLRGTTDRWPQWRSPQHLYQVSLNDGLRRQLTAGSLGTSLLDIHPGGKKILLSRVHYDELPFDTSEFAELNLEDLSLHTILSDQWLYSASYSPDGTKLLFKGGPSAFAGLGENLPQGTIPNNYDGQLYLLELNSDQVKPLTKDFAPGVQVAQWTSDGNVVFKVQEGPFTNIYNYDVESGEFSKVDTQVDAVGGMSLARTAPVLAWYGSRANAPYQAFVQGEGRARLLLTPDKERFAQVQIGQVEDWDFQTKDGTTITGRVHLPPDFDPN
ncbi:MAG: hypothetical protein HN348_34195, partial [Proteobacteria bacterium]|nr:hypothetical protein [Pseudomonadota bacterium]